MIEIKMSIEKLTGTLVVEGGILDISDKAITAYWIEDDTLTEGNTRKDGDQKNKTERTYFIPLSSLNFPENFSLMDLRQRLSEKQNGRGYSFPIRHIIQPDGQSRIDVLSYTDNVAGWSDHLKGLHHHPGEEILGEK